jgi:hypothetical protein
MKRINQTTLFLILTFAISFSIAAIYKLIVGEAVGNVSYTIMGAIYMFAPMVSVIAAIWIYDQYISKEKIMTNMIVKSK